MIVISRDNFMMLKANFACGWTEDVLETKGLTKTGLFKVEPLIQWAQDRFQRPPKQLWRWSIDEKIPPFKGRIPFRQYIKAKIHEFGQKWFIAVSYCKLRIFYDYDHSQRPSFKIFKGNFKK